MKELYKIAENVLSVRMPDGLSAWEKIKNRYLPFAVFTNDMPDVEIEIKVEKLSQSEGTIIYEPEFDGIGFISGNASRLSDGSIAMEFRHIDEIDPRLLLKTCPGQGKAEIIFSPGEDEKDPYFLTHALMIAYITGLRANGSLMLHASTVICGGLAYVFQGRSGTGKSTHSSLWLKNIDGSELLNDDHPIVRFMVDGRAKIYGSPWSGKTHCYRNESAPVNAFVRIVRADKNSLLRLSPLHAYASLTASIYYLPFLNKAQREIRHRTIERLVETTGCYEMYCLPNAEAALKCFRGLTNSSNND